VIEQKKGLGFLPSVTIWLGCLLKIQVFPISTSGFSPYLSTCKMPCPDTKYIHAVLAYIYLNYMKSKGLTWEKERRKEGRKRKEKKECANGKEKGKE